MNNGNPETDKSKSPLLITRRSAIASGAAGLLLPSVISARALAATEDVTTHGLSTFGELALAPGFRHFGYVNPNAPKGGRLLQQSVAGGGNINPLTFDTLNAYIFRGDGVSGTENIFDTLMQANLDEPNSVYGLVAHKVSVSTDNLTYKFYLRPEARFHDGSKLTAHDAAFSFTILKTKAHPSYKSLLRDLASATVESDYVLTVKFLVDRSRDIHLIIAELPIFSRAYWSTREFDKPTLDVPLGSGPYKIGKFQVGRNIEFDRVKDYWARDLPVNVGHNNFDMIRYEYFRDRQIAFEAFKSGELNFREEFTSRRWHTAYNFPAMKSGKVKKKIVSDGSAVPTQGWYFNTRRPKFKDRRIREAIALAFDFEWTNRNIMFSTYKRITSYFENTEMKAVGKPSAAELALLEKWRDKLPAEVFDEPWLPPVSNSKGYDRRPLRKAHELLRQAGCKPSGQILLLPDGRPFKVEFLNSRSSFKPHTQPFQSNLRKLGIQSTFRVVDAAQYKRRIDQFDFDISILALGGTLTPDDGLRNRFSSAAVETAGSHNRAGINDPIVDELVGVIANAQSSSQLVTAAKALDRVLRAGRYWIPMWYKNKSHIAFWNVFGFPDKPPKFATGAPGTWWWDEKLAGKSGRKD